MQSTDQVSNQSSRLTINVNGLPVTRPKQGDSDTQKEKGQGVGLSWRGDVEMWVHILLDESAMHTMEKNKSNQFPKTSGLHY